MANQKKIPQTEINKIPQLPRGEGSITVVDDGTRLKFQKSINGTRKAVYGVTVAEVFKKMKEKEKDKGNIRMLLKLFAGKYRELNLTMYILSILCILKYVFV